MPKTKRGPSLFEVIRERGPESTSDSLNLPGWWRSRASDAEAGHADKPATGRSAGGPDPATQLGQGTTAFITIDGPRLVLTFSSFSAAVGLLLFILLLGGAYWIGQANGLVRGRTEGFATAHDAIQTQALNDIELARRSPPRHDLFAGLPSSPVKSESLRSGGVQPPLPDVAKEKSQANRPRWVKGHTYIVVQEFRAEDRADAEQARRFLQEHHIETTIISSEGKSKYKYRLVTRQGFNCDDPVQKKRCSELHARIRQLGDLFFKAGGRYNLQGYWKKATANRS